MHGVKFIVYFSFLLLIDYQLCLSVVNYICYSACFCYNMMYESSLPC